MTWFKSTSYSHKVVFAVGNDDLLKRFAIDEAKLARAQKLKRAAAAAALARNLVLTRRQGDHLIEFWCVRF